MEFKAFEKINSLRKVEMVITQKIHGTNAQVFIIERQSNLVLINDVEQVDPSVVMVDGKYYELRCGSRTRWIYPGDDNYGFAAFVDQHKEEFIRKLGVGQHFGEWAGLGINSGEGLDKKVFVLFDFWKYPPERELPPGCVVVPVLYKGVFDLGKIEEVMTDLKTNGSKLVPGFMRPEGIVINTMGARLKKVFEAEETQWKRGDEKAKAIKEEQANLALTQFGHLFQPIRMEKLLSRDEKYIREFPASLPIICKDYIEDLIAEGQIVGDEGYIKSVRKVLGSELFKFAKECVAKQGQL